MTLIDSTKKIRRFSYPSFLLSPKLSFKRCFTAGLIAGIGSGFVKLGWEIPFPPRTPDRVTPPQILLEKLGFSPKNWTYEFSHHTINYGNLLIHFSFSCMAAITYMWLVQYFPKLALGYGSIAGIAAWVIFHEIVLPLCHLTPAAWNLPRDEQISEFFGHIVWMASIECLRREMLKSQSCS